MTANTTPGHSVNTNTASHITGSPEGCIATTTANQHPLLPRMQKLVHLSGADHKKKMDNEHDSNVFQGPFIDAFLIQKQAE